MRLANYLIVILVSLVLASPNPSHAADFSDPPVQLSSVASGLANPDLAIDQDGHLGVVSEKNGDIYFLHTTMDFGTDWNITNSPSFSQDPRVATGTGDKIGIVYETDGDIRLLSWPNNMTVPLTISYAPEIEELPSVAENSINDRALAWQRADPSGPAIYLLLPGATNGVYVDDGETPQLAYDENNALHLLYRRDFDLMYRRYPAGSTSPDVTTAIPTLAGVEQWPVIACSGSDALFLYMNDNGTDFDVRLTRYLAAGTFEPPVIVGQADGTCSADLAVSPTGSVVAVALSNSGTISIAPDVLGGAPLEVLPTPQVTDPTLVFDDFEGLHVVYDQNGTILYSTNAAPPTADFVAISPSVGEQPFSFEIGNASSGVYWTAEWNVGGVISDGLDSASATLGEVSTYPVTLTVHGPGGSDTLTRNDFLEVTPAGYRMRLTGPNVRPGDSDVYADIAGTTAETTQGFQLAFRYDDSETIVTDVQLSAMVQSIGVEFFVANIESYGADSYSATGVLFDFQPPFQGQTMPVIEEQAIAHIRFDVKDTAPLGTAALRLDHPVSNPAIFNIFIVNGQSRSPFLVNESIEIVDLLPFIRGDFDGDGTLLVTDVVNLLAFMFSSGPAPSCLDAADVDDDGAVVVVDAVVLLSYLFSSGPPPASPFPDPGVDTTPDALGDCVN